MGSTIGSVPNMISFAGDLRREAQKTPAPEMAAKLQIAAKTLESQALERVGQNDPMIGKLLDTFV
jgi:hypothetical protein